MTSIVRLFSNTSEARTNENARVTLVIIQRVLYNNPSHTRILLGSKPKYEEYEEEEPKDTQTNKRFYLAWAWNFLSSSHPAVTGKNVDKKK